MDADEFPIIDTLPRIFGPQIAPDAPTRQLTSATRGSDTRPLLADEYPAPIAAQLYSRGMWRSWRVCAVTLVGALVFQFVALLLVEAFLRSIAPRTAFIWRPTTAYEWLQLVPYGLLVLGAVGLWRKSRAVAWGLLLSIFVAFCFLVAIPMSY